MSKKRVSKIIKLCDFFLGVPLLFLLGLLKKKKKLPETINSIGILKSAALGDTVLLSAIIDDIKSKLPTVRIILFSGQDNSILSGHIPNLDCNIALPIKKPISAIRTMRTSPIDLLIDFGAWPRFDALLSFFSRSGYTIGFKTPNQFRHFAYDHHIDHDKNLHEMENYRNLVKVLKINPISEPKLKITEPVPKEFADRRYCIFHLCGTGSIKSWPLEYWIQAYDYLTEEDFEILLSGALSDVEENEAFCQLIGRPENIHNLAGKYSISRMMSIIAGAKLTISVNTGILHISAALGTPTIGLNGPTSEKRWGVIGPNAYNVSANVEGCQFLNLGFEYKGQRKDCMKFVSPAEVIKKIRIILRKKS